MSNDPGLLVRLVGGDLTLRDKFAMAALTGLLAAEGEDWNDNTEGNAATAYAIADAMLRERSGEAKRQRDERRANDACRRAVARAEREKLEAHGFKPCDAYEDGGESWEPPPHFGGGRMSREDAIALLASTLP